MTTPRHPGSRMVDHPPNLPRVIQRIRSEVRSMRERTRPETLTFAPSSPARGEPCTSATLIDTHETLVYRSGDNLYADVACGTGSGSLMEVRFNVPDLALAGVAVQTGSGGTERIVRITLPLPAEWASGAAHLTYVQARRVSGADATTVRVLRAWQR